MSDQTLTEQPTAQDAPDATEQMPASQDTAPEPTPAPAAEDQDTPDTEPAEEPEIPDAGDEDQDTEDATRDPRVTKARAEAAKYRHRARDAEATLATVTAERDEALAKLATIEHDRLTLDACRAAHIPDAMAAHITGTTPDEITASARAMSAAMGYDRGPVDPSQGRGTGGDSGTGPGGQTTWADVLGTGNHDL